MRSIQCLVPEAAAAIESRVCAANAKQNYTPTTHHTQNTRTLHRHHHIYIYSDVRNLRANLHVDELFVGLFNFVGGGGPITPESRRALGGAQIVARLTQTMRAHGGGGGALDLENMFDANLGSGRRAGVNA